jgi:hypothetical protein
MPTSMSSILQPLYLMLHKYLFRVGVQSLFEHRSLGHFLASMLRQLLTQARPKAQAAPK